MILSGTITTVAGTGAIGYSGDGGVGNAALLNYPMGVAVSSIGDLYIADFYNNIVRWVRSITKPRFSILNEINE